MKKKILNGLLALIGIGLVAAFIVTRPSGDIENYTSYWVDDVRQPTDGRIKATFFGVSTLLLDDGETQLLIDAFFSRPPLLPLLTTTVKTDTALIDVLVAKHQMNRVKGIFATHSHFDHALDVAYTAKKTNATLYGSISTINIGHGGGLKEKQLELFQPQQEIQVGKFTVRVIPSKHSQPNTLQDDGVFITKPVQQPIRIKAYSEGGSYDFLIKHNGHSIYVKSSANYIENALDTLTAEAFFVAIATIGKKDDAWKNTFYEQTVGKLKPKVIVPLHWDDFTKPLSGNLEMLPRFADKTPDGFDFMITRSKADNIDFKILQGTKSILLFDK